MRQYAEDTDLHFSGFTQKYENSEFFFEAKTKQSDNLVEKVMWSFRFVPKYTVQCGIQRHECISNHLDNHIFVFTLFVSHF